MKPSEMREARRRTTEREEDETLDERERGVTDLLTRGGDEIEESQICRKRETRTGVRRRRDRGGEGAKARTELRKREEECGERGVSETESEEASERDRSEDER